MPAPVDDGVSALFWNEDGVLTVRETGEPLLSPQGEPVVWTEPEPDPNESLAYEGPAIWTCTAYRLDLPKETAVTLWVEAPTEHEACAVFASTAGYGMGLISIAPWQPTNLAQHLRWLRGAEGNLAAVISRPEEG